MTELTPETITDAQVDEFFGNEGSFKESQPEIVETLAEKPADKQEEQPEVETKEEPKEEKKVNLGALHEERMRRKAEAERAKKAEEERDQLRAQLQQYAQPKKEVSYDDDPIEAIRRDNETMKKILLAQADSENKKSENAKYWDRVKESELAFKQDKPEFDDAVKFLANTRLEELKDLGWSDQEAAKILADETKWIADKAYADEVNPAERFWNLAQRRGYKAKETPKDTSADEKLNTIKKGMETNRQLPPASKSVKQDLTAESVADMNIDALSNLHGQTDFDKAWNKLFNA